MDAKIEVWTHNPHWRREYTKESGRLRRVLGAVAEHVHHIGSTSIPTTQAKPIIDILLEVTSLPALDALTTQIEALGYEAKGEYGIPGRRYFRRDGARGKRLNNVHAFEVGSPGALRHLAFRDYLLAHADVAQEYGELKARLAAAHPHDMEAYMDGKDAFVKEHERRALAWSSHS